VAQEPADRLPLRFCRRIHIGPGEGATERWDPGHG
jgi:hypothetical protein